MDAVDTHDREHALRGGAPSPLVDSTASAVAAFSRNVTTATFPSLLIAFNETVSARPASPSAAANRMRQSADSSSMSKDLSAYETCFTVTPCVVAATCPRALTGHPPRAVA